MFAFPESVEFLAPGTVTDPYSDKPSEDWSTPTTALLDSCGVAPAGSVESLRDGDAPVDWDFDLIFDHVIDVKRTWRVRVRGEVMEVQGRPAVWRSPFTGWQAGTVVRAVGVNG